MTRNNLIAAVAQEYQTQYESVSRRARLVLARQEVMRITSVTSTTIRLNRKRGLHTATDAIAPTSSSPLSRNKNKISTSDRAARVLQRFYRCHIKVLVNHDDFVLMEPFFDRHRMQRGPVFRQVVNSGRVYRFYATDLGKRMVQSGDFRNPYTGQQFDDVELMRLTHMLRRHEAFRYNLVTQKPSLIRAAQIRGEEARMGDFFEERFNAFVDQVVEMEARCEEGVRVIAMILAINNSFPELADVIHAFGALDADRQARVVQAGLERLQQVITNSQQHLFRSIAQNVVCTILRILHPVRCERFHMQFFAENIMAAHESRPLMFVPSVQILGNLRGTTAMGVHISAAISAVADAHLNAMLLNNVVV